MIGTTLAHYRITAALGAGGMGEVWRAHDEKLGREVAIKVLPEEFSADPKRLDRFEREARAVASLNHPHIVTIYSVEEVGSIHFLTMELVDGRTLETLIPEGGFDLESFFELATPLAEAISAAHDKSVIHRDLKPANVMVDGGGRVKVMDFGLAKLQDSKDASDSSELPTEALTGIGTIVGTVPYMSPEQVEGLVVDHRTDVFSLGVLLYEMATGERPFSGESSPALMSSILRDVPSSVIEVRHDLPRHLGRIITRCLEKDRRDRYQTARDVFNELRSLKREASGDSVASAAPRVVPVRRPAVASSGSRLRPGRDRAIAVAPFRAPASDTSLAALAEGLAEDVTNGLARFPYLTIIDGAQLGVGEDSGTTTAGLGVRYILRGGLRSAGSELRLSVQLVEVETGAHVWSETYDRSLDGASLFELQDDLTDRVVASMGDYSGVMARLVAAELRAMDDDEMDVDDWIMRAVCYVHVVHPPEEHAAIRDGLEAMVELHPDNAEAHAWLANTYANEFAFGFNPLEDPIGRSLQMAQRAVDLDPTTQAGWLNLAGGHFFLGDLAAFEAAATRAMALNPSNSYAIAYMGLCFGNSGQRERGAELGTRACALNPHHPEWYPFVNFYYHYAREEYEDACLVAKGINWPKFPYTHINFAAACGQLGRPDEARTSIETLRETFGYDLEGVRKEFLKWRHTEDFVEHILDGLRKAGMDDDTGSPQSSVVNGPKQSKTVRPQTSGEFDLKSIAVLPFVNMSDDRENEFFSDGVTEEILTSLSKIRGLRVISRTSAMTYKGTSKSIREISAELEVGTVLEGSVRRAGDRVRVTAQLIEAATDKHLWSESYDRDLEDIFAVQGDVALQIAQALRTELGSDVVEQIRRRPTENVEAYDLYLKGRQGVRTLQAPEVLRGIEQLEEAIGLDPDFSAAHGQLAISHVFSAYWGAARGRDDLVQARRAAERALALDPENVLARVARAGVLSLHDFDWEGAVAELKTAVEFDPNEIESHFWYGVTLFLMGRFEDSVAAHKVALALDPRSPNVISQLGLSLYFSGDRERGKRLLREGIEQHPVFFDLPNFLAMALKREGRFEEAAQWFARTSELTGHHPVFEALHASTLRLAGSDDEARRILDRLVDSDDDPRIDSVVRAVIAVAERDSRSAVENFNDATDQRLPLVFWFRPGLLDLEFPPDGPGVRALWRRLWPDDPTFAEPCDPADVDRESIAVLPFSNLSADPEQEFFADGMADEILNALAQVPQLQVAARTSSFSFKGKDDDLQSIGRKLNVTRVLEGSVRTVGNRVRITAQLINVSDGYHIWSERYDRTMDDIFAIQDEIAQSIVDRLRTVPAGAPAPASYQSACDEVRTPLVVRPTTSLEAYQLYLKGRSLYYGQMGEAAFRDAIEAYEKAIELDPRFAQPYVGIAEASVSRGFWGTQPAGVTFPKARRAAERALELQDSFGDAHAILGFLSAFYDVDWEASAASFARAEACRHTTSLIPFYQSLCLLFGGKFDDAISEIRKAQQLDPLSANINAHVAHELVWAGRLEEAEDELQRIERLHPGYWFNTYSRALIAWIRGEGDEAIARLEEAVEQTGWLSDFLVAVLRGAHHRFGSRNKAAEIYKALEVPKGELETAAFSFAFTHLLCGETDEGLRWLARARDAHDGLFIVIRIALERLNTPIADEALAQMTSWGVRGPAS